MWLALCASWSYCKRATTKGGWLIQPVSEVERPQTVKRDSSESLQKPYKRVEPTG